MLSLQQFNYAEVLSFLCAKAHVRRQRTLNRSGYVNGRRSVAKPLQSFRGAITPPPLIENNVNENAMLNLRERSYPGELASRHKRSLWDVLRVAACRIRRNCWFGARLAGRCLCSLLSDRNVVPCKRRHYSRA